MLYAQPSKCEWLQTSLQLLGHQNLQAGHQVDTSQVNALQRWPLPTNQGSEIRTFLGTFGCLRPYIKSCAHIVAPLNAHTSENVVWSWLAAPEAAVAKLKATLLTSPVLVRPDQDRPFRLATDASDYAIGASFEREDDAKQRHPVALFSHSLNSTECNYETYEL